MEERAKKNDSNTTQKKYEISFSILGCLLLLGTGYVFVSSVLFLATAIEESLEEHPSGTAAEHFNLEGLQAAGFVKSSPSPIPSVQPTSSSSSSSDQSPIPSPIPSSETKHGF